MQVRFTQDQHMIQALSPDRADQPLGVPVLPGRPRRRWSIPDPQRTQTLLCNYTDQGIRAVKDSSMRQAAAKELGKKFGKASREAGRARSVL